jgi:hypothetical protein
MTIVIGPHESNILSDASDMTEKILNTYDK